MNKNSSNLDAIRLSACAIGRVKEATFHSAASGSMSKINGIKALRAEFKEKTGEQLGLREAKLAIERLIDERTGNVTTPDRRPDIVPTLHIKKIIVDMGEGDIEVDLEELQFRILADINTLGFEETGALLELVESFRRWEDSFKNSN